MKFSTRILLAFVIALSFFQAPVAADLVTAIYEFDQATSGPSSLVGDISGSTMTAGAFTGGTGVATFSSGSDTIFVRTPYTGATTSDGDTIAEAITNEAFASFTITAGAEDVTLDDITWSQYATNTFAGADFRIYAFQESAGFSDGDQIGFTSITENATTTASVGSGTLALSGVVTAGNSEEFRFYFVDNSTSTSRINRLESFTVNGSTAAVPEPSSVALLGLACLAMVVRRRK